MGGFFQFVIMKKKFPIPEFVQLILVIFRILRSKQLYILECKCELLIDPHKQLCLRNNFQLKNVDSLNLHSLKVRKLFKHDLQMSK